MYTQGANLVGLGATVSSMDLNLWPYSNCWDRSTNPLNPNTGGTKPDKQLFGAYFSGWVTNSKSVYQADPNNTIQFVVDGGTLSVVNTDDSIYIKLLSAAQGTLGLQSGVLNMVYRVGADAQNVTWNQQTMF